MTAATTLASKVRFDKMCAALEEIARAKPRGKAVRLDNFLTKCRALAQRLKAEHPEADTSLFPLLRLLLPQLERQRGPLNMREKTLKNLYARLLCLGKTSADASNLLHCKAPTRAGKPFESDFAEKAYRVARNRLPQTGTGLTIEEIDRYLDAILRNRDEAFESLLRKMTPLEFKWFTRILLKDLKLGIGSGQILQAYHPDAKELFEVTSDLREIAEKLQDPRRRYRTDLRIFSHFKPMLLERCRVEEIDKLFGNAEEYFVQTKYDGERSQMHMKAGKYKYFTRRGYEITSNPGYGENGSSGGFLSKAFSRLLNPECESIILDGEVMGWHKEKRKFGSKGMNFDVKKLSANSHYQPCFVAFDIVLYNEQVLLDLPYVERLRILASAINEEDGAVMLCKSIPVCNREEVLRALNESIERKEEGIVVKRRDITYKLNARNGNGCYKIKAEYSDNLVQDLDLLVLGCHYGDGKCAGSIRSFLMGVAVATQAAEPSEFLSLVSVSSGLTQEKLNDLRARLERHWRRSCPANVSPPKAAGLADLWIRPEDSVVLTVRASEMIRSGGYPTGYSLRFPRVMDVRFDKPWYDVCTTAELRSLIKDDGIVQKLTRRAATEYDIAEISLSLPEGTASTRTSRAIQVPVARRRRGRAATERSIGSRTCEQDRPTGTFTRLLEAKEICVINGDEKLSKERIEQILRQHGAKVVQNPRKKTFCVIVGNVRSLKAQNVVRSGDYDVATIEWLRCATREENWSSLIDFRPWDLFSCRESTKTRLAKNYDEFGDRYHVDADEESLRASLSRAGREVADVTASQEKELDDELFPSGYSPYSIFRTIVGHFPHSEFNGDLGKLEFRFMAGIPAEEVETSPTYAFIRRSSTSTTLRQPTDTDLNHSTNLLSDEWIHDSFHAGRLSSTDEYFLS